MGNLRECRAILDQLENAVLSANRIDMGKGCVVIGNIIDSETKVPGIVFASLPDGPREVGADCLDVYPNDTPIDPLDIRTSIFFHNKGAIDQMIKFLNILKTYPILKE